ncbi:MAG: ArnT family glycosyltransferase [Myxococcota bacterium]
MTGEPPGHLPSRSVGAVFAVLIAAQVFLGFLGVADHWTRGHNGWNGAAYHLSARNSLRWEVLFPLQYDAGVTPPSATDLYTHHPLGMHLHNTASVWLFGDHPAAVRGVAAVHGVLALAMLFVFVRRWWDDLHAIVAGAVYVILPINAIYIHMANHSNGFIFWGLLALHCYLRFDEVSRSGREGRWRWYAAMIAAFFMAAQWDWPAYYLAFGVAVHWLVAGLAQLRRQGRPLWKWDARLGALAGWCVWVLALFGGHFVLVQLFTENVGELAGTFEERQNVGWPRFREHLAIVPELMFTWPVLGMAGVWLGAYVVRLGRGRARARDLAPLVFALGGACHYWVFKWSATVHSYWAWTMLPFFAIACASVTVTTGRWLVRRAEPRLGRPLAVAAGALVGLLLVPLVVRSADIVPPARRVGGSMWWVAPVRGPVATDYRSGRPELRFAEQVREWTDRRTGVLVHRSIMALNPEPRFDATLDRETRPTGRIVDGGPPHPGVDGWVLIGVVGDVPFEQIADVAARHPYWQYGRFFMVDLRRSEQDVRVYDLMRVSPSPAWWYFVSPFEDPVRVERPAETERALRESIRERATASRPTP